MNSSAILVQQHWLTGGVDFNLPGNGGLECRDHVTYGKRILETTFGTGLAVAALIIGLKLKSNVSNKFVSFTPSFGLGYNESIRIFLLISFSFIYGLEVSYKFSTRQLVFLINPCHVMSILQIFLLAALPYTNPNSLSTTIFRCVLHWFHGPLLALFFPVTNTRLLPFESETYWLQHILLVVVPIYLTLFTEQYSVHKPLDCSLLLVAYGIWGIYHWCVMQPASVYTLANIGNMLCPAISDPFYGENYRLHAIWHQFLCTFVMGTFCAFIAQAWGSNANSSRRSVVLKKEN